MQKTHRRGHFMPENIESGRTLQGGQSYVGSVISCSGGLKKM